MSIRIDTKQREDGLLTSVIYNSRGIEVATIDGHDMTAESLIRAARKFERDHPELFGDVTLVDTADVSRKKNPNEYGAGKLRTVPGG